MKYRVVIIQRVLPHYRHSFFRELRSLCVGMDVDLQLYYGQERDGAVPKTYPLEESWAHPIVNVYLFPGKSDVCWHGGLPSLRGFDLVVVEHSNAIINNHFWLWGQSFTGCPLAFWGHGRNYQSGRRRLRDVYKDAMLVKASWWFAYTRGGREYVVSKGFDPNRVAVVNNAVDTAQFKKDLDGLSDDLVKSVVGDRLFMSSDVGLFCGGLYSLKRLDFLVDCADAIRERRPGFQLVVVGDGPMMGFVREAASSRRWMHVVGEKIGVEKAAYFKVARVFLMPGLVGLAVLDSFVSGVPMVTTSVDYHSPEIEYLEHGLNGVVSEDDRDAYIDAVFRVLSDQDYYALLVRGALGSASQYSVHSMASNFVKGISTFLLGGEP